MAQSPEAKMNCNNCILLQYFLEVLYCYCVEHISIKTNTVFYRFFSHAFVFPLFVPLNCYVDEYIAFLCDWTTSSHSPFCTCSSICTHNAMNHTLAVYVSFGLGRGLVLMVCFQIIYLSGFYVTRHCLSHKIYLSVRLLQ